MSLETIEKMLNHPFKEHILNSWTEFQPKIEDELYNSPVYVWRGQRDASWGLESGLDREIRNSLGTQTNAIQDLSETVAARHLDRFKQASRGRRGENPNQPTNDDEWWALAQHNAMLTPLLDWTESPFVALYFAFESEETPSSGNRSVWALSTSVQPKQNDSRGSRLRSSRSGLTFIRPQQDENSRLLSQAGLFTKVPLGSTVEKWVSENEVDPDSIALSKFVFPNQGRKECLRLLNRMNINHLSLFPDLYGAGKHCNNVLQIENY